eukprot:SRR837773.21927.p1 GENE.SRR837773.21927~~SRR837773.21927.p1  ORF type:complete len:154 (-),score=21.09 SRR837773.21927:3-464(-)
MDDFEESQAESPSRAAGSAVDVNQTTEEDEDFEDESRPASPEAKAPAEGQASQADRADDEDGFEDESRPASPVVPPGDPSQSDHGDDEDFEDESRPVSPVAAVAGKPAEVSATAGTHHADQKASGVNGNNDGEYDGFEDDGSSAGSESGEDPS